MLFQVAGVGAHGFIFAPPRFVQRLIELRVEVLLPDGNGGHLPALQLNQFTRRGDELVHEALLLFAGRLLGPDWGSRRHKTFT
ncbi:MAG TPA: hypothetical protein VKT49_26185 [Bryobacteraceae bacterium]|nr:hypothetical protein [Bryobacteraceae bacterium]